LQCHSAFGGNTNSKYIACHQQANIGKGSKKHQEQFGNNTVAFISSATFIAANHILPYRPLIRIIVYPAIISQ
jgi:hypothetical protein